MARVPFISAFVGDGSDLIQKWGDLFVSATITDKRGEESDELTLVLDDKNGRVAYPPTGTELTVTLGYRGEFSVVTGTFKIDGVDLEGGQGPRLITLTGTSVDAKAPAAKEAKSETHRRDDTPTVGKLVEKIAGRNGWSPRVASAIASIPLIDDIHQTENSDAAFIDRVVRGHDGMAAVKQRKLVVTRRGDMQSASGQSISSLTIAPALNLMSYRVSWGDRPTRGEVEARFFDRQKNITETVTAQVGKEGGEGVVERIREAFPTKDEAQQAADARANELKRGDGTATFEVEGEPAAGAERPVIAVGIRSGVNGLWVPTTVEHSIGGEGYITRIEAETPGEDSRGEQ